MRRIRRSIVLVVVLASAAGACGSGDDAAGPENGATGDTGDPTGTSGATSPTGLTGSPAAIDACGLVNESDAVATLEGSPVELVEDPIGEDLLNPPSIGVFESVCYYRPVPDDGDRQVAVVVFTPGSLSDAQVEEIVADGESWGGGLNFEAWEIDQTMFVRKGDAIFLIRATTEEGNAPDESAEFDLAVVAAGRVPGGGVDVAACQRLTPDLVSTALAGAEVVASGGIVVDDQTTGCAYAGATEPFVVVLYLTTGPLAATRYDDFREQASDEDDFEDLAGLGDGAFQADPGVVVLEGDTLIDIDVITLGGEPQLDAATALAGSLLATS